MLRYPVESGASEDEMDKPHWISYSDLMTSLMILFLVVMVVSLTRVSQQTILLKNSIQKDEQIEDNKVESPLEKQIKTEPEELVVSTSQVQRQIDIITFCEDLKTEISLQGLQANVNCDKQVIDFGVAGRFASGSYVLPPEGQEAIKKLVPLVLNNAQSELGQKWFKRVQIKGYTDIDGSYLYNLHLSLKRSEWVMCEILKTDSTGAVQLTSDERILARQIFLAGGVSFNDQLSSKEESRRVELKLEYYEVDEFLDREPKVDKLLFSDNTEEVCQI